MAGCGVWANGSEEEARCGGSTLLSGSRGTSVEWMATSRRYFLAYGFRGGHVTRAVAVVVAEKDGNSSEVEVHRERGRQVLLVPCRMAGPSEQEV
jgi:hypothetical protein